MTASTTIIDTSALTAAAPSPLQGILQYALAVAAGAAIAVVVIAVIKRRK